MYLINPYVGKEVMSLNIQQSFASNLRDLFWHVLSMSSASIFLYQWNTIINGTSLLIIFLIWYLKAEREQVNN